MGVLGAAPNQGEERGGRGANWVGREGGSQDVFLSALPPSHPIRANQRRGQKKHGPYFLVEGAKTILHGMFYFSWAKGLNT